MKRINKKLKNFISINIGNELSTISLCQDSSLVFFKTFPFGSNSIYNDINQLCSLSKNEAKIVIENLDNNKSTYIDKKFFINLFDYLCYLNYIFMILDNHRLLIFLFD